MLAKLPRLSLLTVPMVAWAVAVMEEAGDKLKTLFSLFQARAHPRFLISLALPAHASSAPPATSPDYLTPGRQMRSTRFLISMLTPPARLFDVPLETQIVVLLPTTYVLTWPTDFLGFTTIFDFIAVNYVDVLPVDCVSKHNWYNGALPASPRLAAAAGSARRRGARNAR